MWPFKKTEFPTSYQLILLNSAEEAYKNKLHEWTTMDSQMTHAEAISKIAELAEENERLQRIIDSRPAINAGLPDTYINWSQQIVQTEIAQAIGHDA